MCIMSVYIYITKILHSHEHSDIALYVPVCRNALSVD